MIITERLILREMKESDYPSLCKILQDAEVMYAYEHAFSDNEVLGWLNKQLENYKVYGFGLWAVELRDSGRMIGQCGLTMQNFNEDKVVEIGYLFQKDFWHNGYATESAMACKDYAFNRLGISEVFSIIRENNFPSQNVAKRNGMTVCGTIIKHYQGMDMPHFVFSIKNEREA